jgi:hypothetical protein
LQWWFVTFLFVDSFAEFAIGFWLSFLFSPSISTLTFFYVIFILIATIVVITTTCLFLQALGLSITFFCVVSWGFRSKICNQDVGTWFHIAIIQFVKIHEDFRFLCGALFLCIIVSQVLSSRKITMDSEDWIVIMGIIVIFIEAFQHGGNIWKFLHLISLMTRPMCNLSSWFLFCTICNCQVLCLHLDQISTIWLSCVIPLGSSWFYWSNMMINGGFKTS